VEGLVESVESVDLESEDMVNIITTPCDLPTYLLAPPRNKLPFPYLPELQHTPGTSGLRLAAEVSYLLSSARVPLSEAIPVDLEAQLAPETIAVEDLSIRARLARFLGCPFHKRREDSEGHSKTLSFFLSLLSWTYLSFLFRLPSL